MAGRPHWYFWLIGSTNRVQPYCRLAMATMQAMPTTNCITRYPMAACAALPPMAAVLIGSPLLRGLTGQPAYAHGRVSERYRIRSSGEKASADRIVLAKQSLNLLY